MKKKSGKGSKRTSVPSNTLVLVAPDIEFNHSSNVESSHHHLEIIDLKHPRHDSNKFLYNSEKGTIQEILQFSATYRCWFIGNSICSDGNAYISTPIDPLFLILPYLRKSNNYRAFDELLHDDDFRDFAKLECLVDEEQLSQIAVKKEYGDLAVWKYSEENTLKWLRVKIDKVVDVLRQKNLNVNPDCAISKSLVRTSVDTCENYLRYAHGIISEYLDENLSERLLSYLNIPKPAKKRPNEDDSDREEIKKLRKACREKDLAEGELSSNEAKAEKTVKKNPKHVALAKAAAGTRSISSFFKKKEE